MNIGLSEYESKAYIALLQGNPATGYDIAKRSGVPSAKIYATLGKLKERQMVLLVSGERGIEYVPRNPEEYLDVYKQEMDATLQTLRSELKEVEQKKDVSYIWNIGNRSQLIRQAGTVIESAVDTILVSCWDNEARDLLSLFKKKKGLPLSMIHFGSVAEQTRKGFPGAVFEHPIADTLYEERGGRGFVIVADGKQAVMGTVHEDGSTEGAWSGNRGFVLLAEDYIKHDIYIMKVVKRFDDTLVKTFGKGYTLLRDVFDDKEITE